MMVVLLMGCILSMLGMLILVFSSLCLHGYVDVMTSGKAIEKVIRLGVSTTIGTRSTQQDSFSKSPANYDYIIKHKGLFVSVCDGMGGMQGGEIASKLCSDCIYESYLGSLLPNIQPELLMKEAILRADKAISTMTNRDGQKIRAGTTSVSAIIKENEMHWVSVGDSRIYLYENGRLNQITRDHNYYLELSKRVNAHEITQQEADDDPHADALISYVGMGGIRIIDSGKIDLDDTNDKVFVLCSDGLYKALADIEIEAIITQCIGNPQRIADKLIHAVEGKRMVRQLDNTTVAVIGYGY